ncbi:hypothetical protein [Sphingomonas sp.]|uniref:hypothetical protein n=1 Tax=Sphingomonas sp. TaxID=28214 RepID=UPI002B791509|nr:hypothetical protein [Sphingomonas sp.]HWK36720.1 hypothetical protein [Sphingomonas sp.]
MMISAAITLATALAGVPATTAPVAPATQEAAPATPSVGETVHDSAGAVIGTVEAVTPQAVVIKSGTLSIPVAPASVGKGANGWAMGITKAELEAAGQKAQAEAQAQLKAALVAGAEVKDRTGAAVIATVKAADDQFVTVTSAQGAREAKLPANAFGLTPNGIVIGMTADEFNAAVGGAAAPGK